MTDAQRLAALEAKVADLEKSNKLLARDNRALTRDVEQITQRLEECRAEPTAFKGYRVKNFPNGDQEVTPIQ